MSIVRLYRDERGLTTTGMVLSLLIALSLLFASAQVYRINSASAQVQDVADAAALAAENQVAEFMLVARYCDAVVLSLSLTSITVTGLGVVALCVPVTSAAGEKLIEMGKKTIEIRNGFAKRAGNILNKLQKALPFFSAACAASVARANNASSSGANYLGVAVLVPVKGEKIEIDTGEESDEFAEDAEEQEDELSEKAERAEEAAQEANECKERAYMRDCGDDPYYCMYERASTLAEMDGADNPYYASVDTWSFSVALERARLYYLYRMTNEAPADDSVEEQARSALRARFYAYAWDHFQDGYVYETEDEFEAEFPRLPRNTDQMRETQLYTEDAYLMTDEGETTVYEEVLEDGTVLETVEQTTNIVMHSYDGCPGAAGELVGYASISYMESEGLTTCPVCGFRASSMGRVASASSSIDNGFEYHYNAVADEAERYEQLRREAEEQKEEAEDQAQSLLDQMHEALKECAGKRIEPLPPGRYGAVAFVVNAGSTPASGLFGGSFASATALLGPRAAVSAATLIDEGTDEGATIINSVLDGLREDGGVFVGAAGIVLDAWSWMLTAYGSGQTALLGAVEGGLDSLPLVGASGLGTWASEKIEEAIEDVGLQPAKIGALKPVTLNSAHVAAKGDGPFASRYVSVKERIVRHPVASTDLFSAVMTDAERAAIAQVEGLGDSVEIASIELLGEGGPSIPITIPLPEAVKEQGTSAIQALFEQIRAYHAETSEVKEWN